MYDRCARHSCSRHNLWRAFFDGLIDNDEKVASKKHTESKNGSLFKNIIFETRDKNHTLFTPKMVKIDTLLMIKVA